MRHSKRSTYIGFALWVSLVLAMITSMHHVAGAFGQLEKENDKWIGWLAAISIDAGIMALTYGLRNRRKANRGKWSSWRLYFGVLFLTGISIAANYLSARSVQPEMIFEAIAFSATLPIIVVFLSDILSSDDAQLAKKKDQDDERVQALNEQIKQIRIDHDKEILELNARLNKYESTEQSAKQNGWHEQWSLYLSEHPNATQRDIASAFNVSVGTVNNRLKALKKIE